MQKKHLNYIGWSINSSYNTEFQSIIFVPSSSQSSTVHQYAGLFSLMFQAGHTLDKKESNSSLYTEKQQQGSRSKAESTYPPSGLQQLALVGFSPMYRDMFAVITSSLWVRETARQLWAIDRQP